jgi:hypothetical protein
MSITIIQVFRSLGIDPSSDVSWSVGNRVAALYRAEFGADPPKELRQKTAGSGSHCFAVYPAGWRRQIAEIIRAVCADEARQAPLFGSEAA